MTLSDTVNRKNLLQKQPRFWICCALVCLTLVVYGQVRHFDFIQYDDPINVSENTVIQRGFTWEGIVWAFTNQETDYWRPVCWFSHMLDCELFGLHAGGHHVTNLLLHIANVLLLFALLNRWTGQVWRAAMVAAIFAVHPIHVSSVAWVTERKDVLTLFFGLLTMWAYTLHVEKPTARNYALMLVYFALGLMSKPMIITLPFVLLLLDWWPLRRFTTPNEWRSRGLRLLTEKIPLFVLAGASAAATYWFTHKSGQLASTESFSMTARISNVLVSYVRYLAHAFWPEGLSVYYPHPGQWPTWYIAMAGMIVLALTVVALWTLRTRSYVAVGWFWFLGTLVPVIGFVQGNSGEAMGDRFAYLPLIGIYLVVIWAVSDITQSWRLRKPALATVGVLVLAALMGVAWFQVGLWRSSVALFEYALRATWPSPSILNNLGVALAQEGRVDDAIACYRTGLQLSPNDAEINNNLGVELARRGGFDTAISHYQVTLQHQPNHPKVHYNFATALMSLGKTNEAIAEYRDSIRVNPRFEKAHFNLALALVDQGKLDEAILHYRDAIRRKADFAEAHNNLGLALAAKGDTKGAIEEYSRAVEVDPSHARAHYNLGVSLAGINRVDDAIDSYTEALKRKTDYTEAHINLGLLLANRGRLDDAVAHFREAVRLKPTNEKAHFNLGLVLAAQGKSDEARAEFLEALKLQPGLVEVHLQLGMIEEQSGRTAPAIEQYRKALAIRPGWPPAVARLDSIQSNTTPQKAAIH